MKYLMFKRESNDFADILSDKVIKKDIRTKIKFVNHLIISLTTDSKANAYAILKYGDDMINMTDICPDRSPIPGKDYQPERKKRG